MSEDMRELDLTIAKELFTKYAKEEAGEEGKTWRDIAKDYKISAATISKVQKLIQDGAIKQDEKGNAFFAKAAESTVEEIHRDVMGVVTKIAAEEAVKNAENDYKLGFTLRQRFTLKAEDAGMPIDEYVQSAMIFFETYKNQLEDYEKTKAALETLKEGQNDDMLKVAKIEYYFKFTNLCIAARTRGLIIPDTLIELFMHDLDIITKNKMLESIPIV